MPREYVFKVIVPDSYLDPVVTAEEEIKWFKEDDKLVDEFIQLARSGQEGIVLDITVKDVSSE